MNLNAEAWPDHNPVLRAENKTLIAFPVDAVRIFHGSRVTCGLALQVNTMQIVYRAASIIDANLVKVALESVGVMAFVNGAFLTGAAGELPVYGLVSVMVADIDIERAQPVVAEIDEALRAEVDPSDDRFFDLPGAATI